MAEYIKRESIQKALKNVTDDPSCPLFLAAMIEQYIDQEPTADVTPVKHGKWEDYGSGVCCSECGISLFHQDTNNNGGIEPSGFIYCPNCGAKMMED